MGILFCLPILLFSQTPALDYLVLRTGDTLYGKVGYIREDKPNSGFFKKIRLTTTTGKRKKIKREAIACFKAKGFYYEGFWLRQSSGINSLFRPRYYIDNYEGTFDFLRVVTKGALSHYELEWFDQGNSTLWSMALLKKEGDSYFIRADQGLFGLKRKTLTQYFQDCSELSTALSQKKIKEVYEVIDFYNDYCGD
ncbi:MAG: hypothetical protein AAGF77_03535 [Bacteroidota bacterium]